ncbi:hypothetical protein KDN24_21810 [Bacillus sp. Bva_UNVM-123]|uniref:stalk domain-containing protein n=1 Tax=Bacillus sp. Bva_UNVM-123 TaxID=2829798 RepID=UPI00391FBC3F
MWRSAFLIFIALTTSISGMLFWQWKAYSKQNIPDENFEKVKQEIVIKTEEDHLLVTQKIIGLTANKEYTMTVPDSLFDWTCKKADGKVCESNDENPHTFLPDNNEMVFQFLVQMPNKNSAFLMNEWTTLVHDVNVTRTSIEIVDSDKRDGSWVVGAPLKGYKKMDLIDFYLFSNIGEAPSLYWQPNKLQYTEAETGIDLYVEQSGQKSGFEFKEMKDLLGFPYVAVILSDQYKGINGKGLLISSPNITDAELKRKLVHYYFEKKYNMNNHWLLDIFTSYMIEQPPSTEKGKLIVKELNTHLSEEEMQTLFELALNSNEAITTQKMDHFIEQIKEVNTRFFLLNNDDSKPFFPLYFYDDRKVVIANKEVKEIEVIIDNGKMLYPFIDTMKSLGFELKILPDQETILLMKENNSYRFYLNSNIFIYNEEDYGLLESPLLNMNGNIYMSKQWIQTLFNVSFEENEEEIKLSL